MILVDLLMVLILVGGWFGVRILGDAAQETEYIVVSQAREEPAAPEKTPEPEALPGSGTETREDREKLSAEDEPIPAQEDPRTEWQIRFAEHFTEEIVRTENSYTSPNVSVTIEHREMETEDGPIAYHLADIYIGSVDCFRTALAAYPPKFHMSASLQKMSKDNDAIVAVNGDFCSYSYGGIAVRDGVVWSPNPGGADLCALYRDGTMETVTARELSLDEAIQRDVWQVWTFGPGLLNPDGTPREIPWSSIPNTHMTGRNPRTAIGYYEPGHYCFLVADGRQPGYSVGMRLEEMARLFSDLGCRAAFNLDGGGSSLMTFCDEYVSRTYAQKPRNLSDCLLIADVGAPTAAPEGEE